MPGEQQQRLLAAHAAAEGVDPAAVDPQPRQCRTQDLGHPREICDLTRGAPRVAGDASAVRIRVDHGERAAAGQVAPQDRVRAPAQPAPVRRDHQRQRRVGGRPVPGWEHDLRAARAAVVGDVADAQPPHGGHAQRRRRTAAAVADNHLQPTGEPAQVERLAKRLALREHERRPVHRHRFDTLAARQPDAKLQRLRRRPRGRLHDSRGSCRCAPPASTRPARSSSVRGER